MDAQMLVDASPTPGIPAPFWFVEFFKVLGFTLHAVPMNLWYAGVILAMLLYWRGGEHGRRFAVRLMTQMPIIVAFGINLGVVPLLFIQVAYSRVFYPATILMAWFWMAIVALLIPAYYGVYLVSFGVRAGEGGMSRLARAAGWVAAALFVAIGFLFANGWSLMTNVAGWPDLWRATSTAGAALGTGLNVADASMWARWLMFFGLALMTTAAWTVVDSAFLAARESEAYRRWAADFAWKLATAGLAWFVVTGALYAFGTWRSEVQHAMLWGPLVLLTLVTAASPVLPWFLLFRQRSQEGTITRQAAALIGAAQFGVLAVNAISRQIVQNVELSGYYRAAARAEEVQWSPLVMFLMVFVAGVAVVAWMIAQALKAKPAVGE
jgi:hypothetical protein